MPETSTRRYVIGRDGVFATLYDQQEERLVVENSTEEHCRRVLAELQEDGMCPACDTTDLERCVACGSCRCDRHDSCVRPATPAP